MQYCSQFKHTDSKIIKRNKDFSWFYCSNCNLLYCNNKNKNNKNYINKLNIFNNFKDGNTHEFKNILKILKKFSKIKNLNWFDFGCGTGSLLEIVKKETKNVIGFEPNKFLYNEGKKKKLNIINNLSKIKNNKKFDIIFTRNTFKYIDNFPRNMFLISKMIKKNGLFIWRDKYFDFYPRRIMKNKNLDNEVESLKSGSYLFKNAIRYHLNNNKFKILYSKFYLDDSFLIISKKINNKINFKNSIFSLNYIFLKNQYIVECLYFFRKFFYITFNKLKFFLKSIV